MAFASTVVRSDIQETSFSLYTDDEVRALSVCKVTSSVALDSLGNPLQGGLEDPRFGPTDQRSGPCVTCGLTYINCPGHMGHIDLCVPVYHPMHFRSMFQLLRSKCAFCHQFKMRAEEVRYYVLRLKLLEMNMLDDAAALPDLVVKQVLFKEKEGENKNDNFFVSNESEVARMLDGYERSYLHFRRNPFRKPIDVHRKEKIQVVIEEFYRAAARERICQNCNTTSPSIRKDGYSKIFMRPLAARIKKALDARRLKYKSALETKEGDGESGLQNSDDEIDLDDEEEDQMTESDKYLVPLEVQAQIELLWKKCPEILNLIWDRALSNSKLIEKWNIFFMQAVLVPPARYRPRSKLGDATTEHAQNHHLSIIISTNESIANFALENEGEEKVSGESVLSKRVTTWIALQNAVNCYMDSGKDPNPLGSQGIPPGIKQILERKEGLFRKNMMGKRVNFCCRSVISPDPYIGTNEVGIPVKFAKVLHYPTPVCAWNVKFMRELVERGPNEYPGANQIEMPDGKLISLANMSAQERAGKAKLLLSNPGVKVYRHLLSGDVLLVNRQPSLHKPSIMAHKARVLEHVREQTLRLNYANCNSYNADFDGDEMNCHFVQDELARAEAYYICNTDNQYIVPTSGNPLRGLIQDHVASGVKLTCKGTFLDREQFQQLLYVAVCGLPGTEVVTSLDKIVLPTPAVLKPRHMWTGKQVVSALIFHMCRPPLPPLHLDGKTRTPSYAFGEKEEEHIVTFRYGELLTGVMDKAAVGNSSLGIVHAVYELYGSELAGRLLTAFGRLFTYYLQQAGHTCGIEDLVLTSAADRERSKLLDKVETDSAVGIKAFFVGKGASDGGAQHTSQLSPEVIVSNEENMARLIRSDQKSGKVKIDGAMQSVINKSASDVIKVCLPNGLGTSFPKNNFSMMVLTGAKGSAVNQSQISCFLGQQALEGQRVPLMISGKSLPSFRAYDSSARAGGFVRDRFLTGVKPQEYYFHCMAGREGLVDTAVKTSRSGYLQRCLVKHLEELRVHYDMTVRDSGHNVVQFFYGEDGLDPMSANLLAGKKEQMSFIARNYHAFAHKYSINDKYLEQGFDVEEARFHHDMLEKMQHDLSQKQRPSKHSFVFVRRLKNASDGWIRSNLKSGSNLKIGQICPSIWDLAEVVKVRPGQSAFDTKYDIKFPDGRKVKRVPEYIPAAEGRGLRRIPQSVINSSSHIQIIRPGLVDPAMSYLRTDKNLGCCSEKFQSAIRNYSNQNPDKIISEKTDAMRLNEAAFEFLVWVKYMRSLACPGEAVGCVAAQSIGEPSTQMTLNTFHLAGHGGANVTLGIPRLREIIMTASKTLKTPTMLIPLHKSVDNSVATTLSRNLSQLPLSILLSHKGGVEVRENLEKTVDETWERIYNIRFNFEDLKRIQSTFGVSFADIKKIVEPKDENSKSIQAPLIRRLRYLIQQEQRRAGESTNAGRQHDSIGQFRSSASNRRRKDIDSHPDDGDADDQDGGNTNDAKKQRKDADESDDEDEDEINEDDEDQGTLRFGIQKEASGYDDDSESDNDVVVDMNNASADSEGSDEEDVVRSSQKSEKSKSSSVRKGNSSTTNVRSSEEQNFIEFSLSFPATSRRLLMVQLAELAAAKTTVRETPNIANAYVLKCDVNGEERIGVQTEGVNFEAIWGMQNECIDVNNLRSNDTHRILETYGVEAARKNIVTEINNVFGAYGIDVNPRHLSLIADFMTRTGSYVAMNRAGMTECQSPFLQMSFETTCSFLTTAAHEGRVDNLESPSARLVMGRSPSVGTGCFDLMLPLESVIKERPLGSSHTTDKKTQHR